MRGKSAIFAQHRRHRARRLPSRRLSIAHPRRHGRQLPTHPTSLAVHQKHLQAVDLRLNGASYNQIKETLGYKSKSSVHAAIISIIKKDRAGNPRLLREIENQRLDRLWMAMFPLAQRGDARAASVCVRISKRRSELEGLNRVRKIRVVGQVKIKGPTFKVYAGFDPTSVVSASGNGHATVSALGCGPQADGGPPPADRD